MELQDARKIEPPPFISYRASHYYQFEQGPAAEGSFSNINFGWRAHAHLRVEPVCSGDGFCVVSSRFLGPV